MKRFKLPNVRDIFIPDPGYTIAEVDLAGADAQVVAWDSGDEDLKTAFRQGVNIHEKNCLDMFGEELAGRDPRRTIFESSPGHFTYYHCLKTAVHATNYVSSPRTLSQSLGWPISVSGDFQSRWFKLHPAIRDWHRRIERQLQIERKVRNAFGYALPIFARPEGALPEALAWIGQSTVAINCAKGWQVIEREPLTTPLLNVHDSIVFQYRTTQEKEALTTLKTKLDQIQVPYPDPLTIQWDLKTSLHSWGQCEKRAWL